ncbi:MAG TPA: phosphoribosylanthranilate isomerase [Candidatus Deferrimicrobiaceae bacterium]|jgi:phosphoribosylanthranilate isomerase
MFRVKICGVMTPEDARMAVGFGADAIGINFCRQSPRYLDPSRAGEVVDTVGDQALVVGVFADEKPETVGSIAKALGLGAVQLCGDESPEDAARVPVRVLKVARFVPGVDLAAAYGGYPCEALLFDAHRPGTFGGTGLTLDWPALGMRVGTLRRPDGTPICWMLAGGLTPENVREAIVAARPFGVDVASGVESAPGKKDPGKVREFITRAKEGLFIAGT